MSDARYARLLPEGALKRAHSGSRGGAPLLPRQLPAARAHGHELHLPLLQRDRAHAAPARGPDAGPPGGRARARLRAAVSAPALPARLHTAPRTPDLAIRRALVCPPRAR